MLTFADVLFDHIEKTIKLHINNYNLLIAKLSPKVETLNVF